MFKVKRVAHSWSNLLAFGVTLPFYPNQRRLRKLLVTSEILRSRLPSVQLETLLGTDIADTEPVTLKAISCHAHNCSVFELAVLAAVTRRFKPQRVLEIGTYDGRSALAIAANLPPDGEVITLNLPPDYTKDKSMVAVDEQLSAKVESGFRWRGHDEAGRIKQVFGNSLEYDFQQWKPTHMAFIDGGHAEPIVRSDTRRVLDIIDKSDGTILWHDATRYGVKPALESLRAEGLKIHLIAGTTIAVLRYKDGRQLDLPY
jgi:hypothetical protein